MRPKSYKKDSQNFWYSKYTDAKTVREWYENYLSFSPNPIPANQSKRDFILSELEMAQTLVSKAQFQSLQSILPTLLQ